MDYASQQRNPGKHPVGLIVVAVGHVALGYALVNGLGSKIVEVIKAPIETKIIEEVKPPEPPPPENLPPPPKFAPPPPSTAHWAIARLVEHVPQLTVVTQNVDDLHERAGSTDVIHLHGSLQHGGIAVQF